MQYIIKQKCQGEELTGIIINTTCTFGSILSNVTIAYINVIMIAMVSVLLSKFINDLRLSKSCGLVPLFNNALTEKYFRTSTREKLRPIVCQCVITGTGLGKKVRRSNVNHSK